MARLKLKDIIEQIRGVSYKPSDVTTSSNGIPILRANNIQENRLIYDDLVYVKKDKVSPKQVLQQDDIVICASSGSKELVGKSGVFDFHGVFSFGAFCKCIRILNLPTVYKEYVQLFFQSRYYRDIIALSSEGANINNIKTENLDNLDINLLSIDEQKKAAYQLKSIIIAIQNKKDTILSLDELVKSQFILQGVA